MTLILGAKDQRVLVLRNGKEIGRSKCRITAGLVSGTQALQFISLDANMNSKWLRIGLPSKETGKDQSLALVVKICSPAFSNGPR
jgi:hypothetical protein